MAANSNRLQGKVAIVTGGASGIGEATVHTFLNHSARVVIADVQDKKGQQLAQTLGSDRCVYIHCDISDENQVKTLIDTTVKRYGQLDIMFCNAGICYKTEHSQSILEFDMNEYEKLFSVNVGGTAACVKHAARAMVDGKVKKGSIICTASLAGREGLELYTDYAMSKHAVIGLMRCASRQLGAYGIRVNCVSPGGVGTPLACALMGKGVEELEEGFESDSYLKGALKPTHIADAVVFLASDESLFVTGHDLAVDAGYHF